MPEGGSLAACPQRRPSHCPCAIFPRVGRAFKRRSGERGDAECAGRQHRGGPDGGGGDGCELEPQHRHGRDPCRERDSRPHRPEEAAEEHAGDAPAPEERLGPRQHARIARKRPEPRHPPLEATAEPVGERIACHRPGGRRCPDWEELDRARAHDRPEPEQDHRRRHEEGDEGEGFAERDKEGQRHGERAVGPDEVKDVVGDLLHPHAGGAWVPNRSTPQPARRQSPARGPRLGRGCRPINPRAASPRAPRSGIPAGAAPPAPPGSQRSAPAGG